MSNDILSVLLKDGYKVGHLFQYPADTKFVYSNFTPRKSRTKSNKLVFFGLQYLIQEYFIDHYNNNFFSRNREEVVAEYKEYIDNYLGKDCIPVEHIGRLHDLGYLPIKIKALPEGTLSPMNVPVLTIVNTIPEFFWVTNMLETLMSNVLWKPSTSATTAFEYRKTFENFAKLTSDNKDFIKWQGHDFSFRGMAGIEDAKMSGGAHLLSFTGTDTIPALFFLKKYYGADFKKELIGGSVAATEHSVMCMGANYTTTEEEYLVNVTYDEKGKIINEQEL